METGVIGLGSLDGAFDLRSTLKSGQSYLWDRPDGRMYEHDTTHGDNAQYQTVVPLLDGVSDGSAVVKVRQTDGASEWESDVDAIPLLTHLLHLDNDLDTIASEMPDEPLVRRAYEVYPGMRLVRDPPFGCFVSFICPTQIRASRIFGIQSWLREIHDERVELDDEMYFVYPTPEQLTEAAEDELCDLSLDHCAPYAWRTAETATAGEATPVEVRGRDYEDAREFLTTFVGVGDKVVDCILLFLLDYLEAVPLDVWTRSAIKEHYPDCSRGNYADTSQATREHLGGRYAGYTQTYVFHYLRSGGERMRQGGLAKRLIAFGT